MIARDRSIARARIRDLDIFNSYVTSSCTITFRNIMILFISDEYLFIYFIYLTSKAVTLNKVCSRFLYSGLIYFKNSVHRGLFLIYLVTQPHISQ